MPKQIKKDYGEVSVLDYVLAGSPKAKSMLGPDFADPKCSVCGAHLSHVFMTTIGILGGDCAATLTGDPATRSLVRTKIPGMVRRMNQGRISALIIELSRLCPETPIVIRGTIRGSGRIREWDGALVGQRDEALCFVKSAIVARMLAAAAIDRCNPDYPIAIQDKMVQA